MVYYSEGPSAEQDGVKRAEMFLGLSLKNVVNSASKCKTANESLNTTYLDVIVKSNIVPPVTILTLLITNYINKQINNSNQQSPA